MGLMKKSLFSWQSFSITWWSILYFAILACSVDAFSPVKNVGPFQTRSSPSPIARQVFYDASITECIGSGYSYCLDNYYLPTQAATGAFCASVGDVIAQFSERNEVKEEDSEVLEYDPVRTFHYFLKGLGGGVMWAYWFEMSEPLSESLTQSFLGAPSGDEPFMFQDDFPSMALKERAARTVINIMMEQFFVSPFLFMIWDIPLPALLRGTPLRQIPNQIQSKMGPLFVANAKVWTLVNLITYNIPVEYRVLFSSCADIVWQSINAGITSQEISPTRVPLPPPVEETLPQQGRGTIMATSAQQEFL